MDEYSSDELIVPNWMNVEFFEEVLRNSEHNDSISIRDLKIAPATKRGEHYASILFRVAINYDTSEIKGNSTSVIIKSMPEMDGPKKDLFAESHIFETEIGVYSETIPKFEAELRKIGDNTVLGARPLYYSLKPRKCIVLEDIVPKGYVSAKDSYSDLSDAKAAFLKLAKWHAVSYKLAAEGDQSVTNYREGLLNLKNVETLPWMTSGMENLIAKLDTIDELKAFAPKLRELEKDLIKRCCSSSNAFRQPAAKGIFVLCHGDFHFKNLMVKKSKIGELEDILLLDFQTCFFGPAVMDIIYAKYLLVNGDLRGNHFDELVQYYFSNFSKTLKSLKFEGELPKVDDFMNEFYRHRHWDLFLLAGFLPIWIVACSESAVDLAELLASNESRKQAYDNPDYIEEVKRLLPIMSSKGYLEQS